MHYNYINKQGILLNRKVLGEDVDDELERIANELYMRNKPQVYQGEKGILINIEKDYESTCVILQQNGVTDPKKKTVFEFYTASNLIKK